MQQSEQRASAASVRKLGAIMLGGCVGWLASAEASASALQQTSYEPQATAAGSGFTAPADEDADPASSDEPTTPDADDATAPEGSTECFPDCRSGYVCHQGECISACNPVCGDEEVCTDAGECVSPGGTAPAAVPVAPPIASTPAPSTAPAPDPTPEPTPIAPPVAPKLRAYQDRVDASPYVRRGITVGGGIGLRACFTDSCRAKGDFLNTDVVRAGVGFRLAASYRFMTYLSAGAELNLAAHGVQYRVEDTVSASVFSWSLLPALYAHPLAFSRWDPFLGLGLGFEQDITRSELGEDLGSEKVRTQTRRGLFRLALGLDVFVTKTITVGPRIDIDRQFAGKTCAETTNIKQDCFSIRGELDKDTRNELAHWVTFGVDAKARF